MAATGAEVYENPLVPHAVLRRMYDAMLLIRGTEPTAAARGRGARSMRGEEACRAASLLSLAAGDGVSDAAAETAKAPRGGSKPFREALAPGTFAMASAGKERLLLAVGAAAALKAQGGKRLLLAYADAQETGAAEWKRVLAIAGAGELPIVFVILPTTTGTMRQGGISDRAQGWGVPGMPVDAADAVALYRVLQESVLRARGGDGPALLECVHWQVPGSKSMDGLSTMRAVLAAKGLLPRRRRVASA